MIFFLQRESSLYGMYEGGRGINMTLLLPSDGSLGHGTESEFYSEYKQKQ